MKIKIPKNTDPLVRKEFAVINQGFFENFEFVCDDADLEFAAQINDSHTNSITKNEILKAYFLFLTDKTGIHPPWGLLNGMRPNKLVHSMKKNGLSDLEIRDRLRDDYLVSPAKTELLLTVLNEQFSSIPDLHEIDNEVSIYIGIPFCPTRCAYCTFAAYAHRPNQRWVEPVMAALYQEIKLVGAYLKRENIKVTTIYLGGGTPTSLSAPELESLLDVIESEITPFANLREITVEAGRPDTLDEEKLALLKKYNIERISINPQSFHQKTLDSIGRHHSVEEVLVQYKQAQALGIKNVNMDLIVGLPGEETGELTYSLDQIKNMQPASLTVHMLAFKRKSELTKSRGLYTLASKDVLTEMAQMTYEFAAENDYRPYYLYRQKNIAANLENIGYAKPGNSCLYNILMMEEAQNILGLGVGSSSKFLIGESVHNPKDLRTYIENYEQYAQKKLELLILSRRIAAKSFVYNENTLEDLDETL